MVEHSNPEGSIEFQNAQRVLVVLTEAQETGKVALHLLPTDDFGGAIRYLDPQLVSVVCKEFQASGRQWEILPTSHTQQSLDAAQAMISRELQNDPAGII